MRLKNLLNELTNFALNSKKEENTTAEKMFLRFVEYYELRMSEGLIKIDEGSLNISSKGLTFAGYSNTITIPLTKIVRVQPYTNAVDICKEGRQRAYKFVWRASITTGDIVAQFLNKLKEIIIVTGSNKRLPN